MNGIWGKIIGGVGGFDVRSFLVAVGGALVLLAGYRMMKKE